VNELRIVGHVRTVNQLADIDIGLAAIGRVDFFRRPLRRAGTDAKAVELAVRGQAHVLDVRFQRPVAFRCAQVKSGHAAFCLDVSRAALHAALQAETGKIGKCRTFLQFDRCQIQTELPVAAVRDRGVHGQWSLPFAQSKPGCGRTGIDQLRMRKRHLRHELPACQRPGRKRAVLVLHVQLKLQLKWLIGFAKRGGTVQAHVQTVARLRGEKTARQGAFLNLDVHARRRTLGQLFVQHGKLAGRLGLQHLAGVPGGAQPGPGQNDRACCNGCAFFHDVCLYLFKVDEIGTVCPQRPASKRDRPRQKAAKYSVSARLLAGLFWAAAKRVVSLDSGFPRHGCHASAGFVGCLLGAAMGIKQVSAGIGAERAGPNLLHPHAAQAAGGQRGQVGVPG